MKVIPSVQVMCISCLTYSILHHNFSLPELVKFVFKTLLHYMEQEGGREHFLHQSMKIFTHAYKVMMGLGGVLYFDALVIVSFIPALNSLLYSYKTNFYSLVVKGQCHEII